MFGLAGWYRDDTLAEYVAVEARNLAPLPGDVDFTVGAACSCLGLTAWQGLFQHGRLKAGRASSCTVPPPQWFDGDPTRTRGRRLGPSAPDAPPTGGGRSSSGAEFVELGREALKDVNPVDLVFHVFGGDIGKRAAALIRSGGALVSIAEPIEI